LCADLSRVCRKDTDAKAVDRTIKSFRARRESLLAVDELVGDVIASLDEVGALDHTIVIFTEPRAAPMGLASA
jgi:membrane-anchored protein YejM (alkaline phosphatase superfamily)